MRLLASSFRKTQKVVSALKTTRQRKALRLGVAATGTSQPMLRRLQPDLVLDVGANRGQFALDVRRAAPSAKVLSFEPLPDACAVYRSVFEHDGAVRLVQTAVGAERGFASLNVSRSDDSSSLLGIKELQHQIFPGTAKVGVIEVAVERLSDLVSLSRNDGCVLLKIDVQGFELEVLRGAGTVLQEITWIYVECSFVELYKDQALADEVLAFCADNGFFLTDIVHVERHRGVSVQADFLLGRRASSAL